MKTIIKEDHRIEGFAHIMIGHREGGVLVIDGDSGWVGPNTVVNLGFQDYLCAAIGGVAGSKQISHLQLGTGTAPNATHTALDGETAARKTTSNSVISSKTLQMTVAFASGDHPGGTPTLKNVGLFNTSSGGTLCCGNTYATSQWQSNQGLSATYQLRIT